MKKGQFTILVVFGLLALIVVGIIVVVKSSVQEQASQANREEAVSNYLEANSVRRYAQTCLESTSQQALLLLAKQGGVIWKNQSGVVNKSPDGMGKQYLPLKGKPNYNVSYVLRERDHSICSKLAEFTNPWQYPYAKDELDEDSPEEKLMNISYMQSAAFYNKVCTDSDSGYYGVRTLPELCTYKGPNWKGSTLRPSVYRTCGDSYDYKKSNPVQQQLSNYTESILPKCTGFEDFEQTQGAQVEILNKPSVSYLFGKDTATINATYPVRVSIGGRPPITVNVDFQSNIDTSFMNLYLWFRNILKQEARKVTFEEENYTKLPHYQPSFEHEWIKDCKTCTEKGNETDPYADILRVWDENSLVGDNELVLQGVVKNRSPVLDLLGEPHPTKPWIGILEVKHDKGGPFNVEIHPRAADPENTDNLTYEYLKSLPDTSHGAYMNSRLYEETNKSANVTWEEDIEDGNSTIPDHLKFVLKVSDETSNYDYQEVWVKLTNAVACGDGEQEECSPPATEECTELADHFDEGTAVCTDKCTYNTEECISYGG